MQILFKKILSLQQDKAVCSLLVLNQKHKIMLDCGIDPQFNLAKYRQISDELKEVKIVLISHSSLQFSGAYPFLVSEFKMEAKICYTTQPIMRYSPLNVHEELLSLRISNYNRKMFNKIYSYYEDMQLVKPFQKKTVNLDQQSAMKDQGEEGTSRGCQNIHFTCFLAGGSLGSLYWRISYGLVNIMYLVEYNNYSMNHIDGLDMQNLITQPISLLITDPYPRSNSIFGSQIYQTIEQLLQNFYHQNKIEVAKPKLFNAQSDQKLLIACYPCEQMVEILFILAKILLKQFQSNLVERIGVIHLSSRYMELVKSQSQFFRSQFKTILEKMNEVYKQTTAIQHRISVCSLQSLSGVLAQPQNNVRVYFVGTLPGRAPLKEEPENIALRLRNLNLFVEEEEKILRSTSKNSISKIQSRRSQNQMEVEKPIAGEPPIKQESASIKQENDSSNDLLIEDEIMKKKNLNTKYIAVVSGIPRFNLNRKQKFQEITEYGLRHHTDTRNKARTIYDVLEQNKPISFEERMLSKKQSKVEVMNISFELPELSKYDPLKFRQVSKGMRHFHETEYNSSLRVINLVKPKNIIMVNTGPKSEIFRKYQEDINRSRQPGHKIKFFDSAANSHIYLSYKNELLLCKMNYLPETQLKKVQKVKGTIFKEQNSNIVLIHLDCVKNNEVTSFRLEQFYGNMQNTMNCSFTGNGVSIEGVKIYRKDNYIVLEGEYTEEYFKVRKALYQFLELR